MAEDGHLPTSGSNHCVTRRHACRFRRPGHWQFGKTVSATFSNCKRAAVPVVNDPEHMVLAPALLDPHRPFTLGVIWPRHFHPGPDEVVSRAEDLAPQIVRLDSSQYVKPKVWRHARCSIRKDDS